MAGLEAVEGREGEVQVAGTGKGVRGVEHPQTVASDQRCATGSGRASRPAGARPLADTARVHLGALTPAAAHLAAACAYAGFQVTVTVLVYPQLAAVGRSAPAIFTAHEARHSTRTAVVVGPLFAALVAATTWLVVGAPASILAWAAAACTAVVLGVTALAAVPRHDRLRRGFDAAVMGRLRQVDAVRAVAALVQVVLAVVVLARR